MGKTETAYFEDVLKRTGGFQLLAVRFDEQQRNRKHKFSRGWTGCFSFFINEE